MKGDQPGLAEIGEVNRWAGTHSLDDPYNQQLPWRLFFSVAWQSTATAFAMPTPRPPMDNAPTRPVHPLP